MKKPSKELFELIKSLDKGEKIYFKKFSQLHTIGKQNKYLLLFDAVDSQREYDEATLSRNFKGKIFVEQFAVAKKYLYNQVLKSLRSYHRSVHSEVRDLLHSAEILFEKGLYKQSHKAIIKAKQTAKKNEMYYALMEIYRIWETNLAFQKYDMGWVKNIMAEKAKEYELIQNTEIYRDMDFKILVFYYTYGKARKKQDLAEMKKIMTSAWMQNASKALTVESKFRFYNAHAFYYDAKGHGEQVYKYSKKIIDLFHANPQTISFSFRSYMIRLGNMIIGAIHSKKYEDTEIYLARMKEASPLAKSSAEKATFFYYYHYLLLGYLNNTGQFAKAANAVFSITSEFSEYEKAMNTIQKKSFFLNVAVTFFGVGQYKKCLFWLNRIHNELFGDNPPDLQSEIMCFSLIAHHEAGNTDLLPYVIQSVYRTLKKKEQLYKFEVITLNFLRNDLPKINPQTSSGEKELIQAFQKLKNKLLPLTKDEYEKNAFNSFDYISWLESKIENRSYAEVVRNKGRCK